MSYPKKVIPKFFSSSKALFAVKLGSLWLVGVSWVSKAHDFAFTSAEAQPHGSTAQNINHSHLEPR